MWPCVLRPPDLDRRRELLLRLRLRDSAKSDTGLEPPGGARRLVLFEGHVGLRPLFLRPLEEGDRLAFLEGHEGLLPVGRAVLRPTRLFFPRAMAVRTWSTCTLKSFSTACFTWIFVASRWTSNAN